MIEKIEKDIKDKYYIDHYPNEGQRFVAWYLRNIHNLDPIEAKDCITDGAGDKQIDAVYIDDQDSVIYIIQGKYYNSKVDGEPLREILSAWAQLKDLKQLQENANDKLKSKINAIQLALEDDYTICFELITTGELTESALNDLDQFKKIINEDDTINANFIVVDKEILNFKYEEAMNKNRPYINYDFHVEPDKMMKLDLDGINAVIAAIPLSECIKIPGIQDGSLFRKNVRQSLGNNNKINKGIANTLKYDISDFFLLHNGITAICSGMDIHDDVLSIRELNVVNGCQSLNTIFSCSEYVRNNNNGYIMFRFYEISSPEKADKISISTNSQSAVKARDLRSNDKSVIAMKKSYEQRYLDGYFITKRGENVNTAKYNTSHIVNLTDLGKQMMAWHSQRPTISYSETKIFDKYFNQLFHKDYSAENMQALNELCNVIQEQWIPENPMNINPALLARKSYAIYHHMFALSMFFCVVNNMPSESVPNPAIVLEILKKDQQLFNEIVLLSGSCLNLAFENASTEAVENGKIFSPENWIKQKGSLRNIRDSVRSQMMNLNIFDKQKSDKIKEALTMAPSDFEERWSAD